MASNSWLNWTTCVDRADGKLRCPNCEVKNDVSWWMLADAARWEQRVHMPPGRRGGGTQPAEDGLGGKSGLLYCYSCSEEWFLPPEILACLVPAGPTAG